MMNSRLGLALFSTVMSAAALDLGCAQDPLRIPQLPDGGSVINDSMMIDQRVPVDLALADIKPDTSRSDLSFDACLAQPEACNNVDDNCNGTIDEGYDKLNNPSFCESCKGCKHLLGKAVLLPGCKAGKCTIASCKTGFFDLNKNPADGCEYQCTPTGAVEICDGLDNDCNGKIDDKIAPLSQQICRTLGACAGTKAVCKGADGWVCQYGKDVELQPCKTPKDCGGISKCVGGFCTNVVRIDEQRCDGKDGDCDGLADDPWKQAGLSTALGKSCAPTKSCTKNSDCPQSAGSKCISKLCSPKLGLCADKGVYVCDATGKGTVCKLQTAGKAPAAEKCNGLDDNCNGRIDDNVTDEAWVNIGGVRIFKYEASRPDATSAKVGIASQGRPCSVSSRLPWANITRTAALAACRRAGARLCTVAEWQKACRGSTNTNFPYGNAYNAKICNGRAYNAAVDVVLVTQLPAGCVSKWGSAGSILNMSGNVKEWVATRFSGGNPVGYEIKGGAFDTPSIPGGGNGLSCNYQLPAPTSSLQLSTLGFRCCK